MKEDGKPISPQYLNDIEHDRRNPSGELLIEQFARALNLPKESLMIAAGSLPEEIMKLAAEKIASDRPDQVAKAFKVFRAKIRAK
jgi:transcriptional regulator with XRE-family HTH domain